MVGLLADRSADLIAAMLGVVKAGAAYVPLDPRYPAERLRFMARDSGCLVVLASAAAAARAGELPCPVIDIASLTAPLHDREASSGDSGDAGSSGDASNTGAAGDAAAQAHAHAHAAYVIYTSGSTGQPKGVVVTQGNVLRLFSSTHLWFGFDENDVWTFFHSFAFDFSVWELWGALLHGGRVVVVPYEQSRDPDGFYELLDRKSVV